MSSASVSGLVLGPVLTRKVRAARSWRPGHSELCHLSHKRWWNLSRACVRLGARLEGCFLPGWLEKLERVDLVNVH